MVKTEKTHMPRPNNGAVPVAHQDIVRVLETVGARPVANALLALLELLEEAEVARHCPRVNPRILA